MASFFSSSPKPTAPPPATGLRVQSAVAGKPMALLWGQNRLSGNLVWYGDFVARPNPQSGGRGGKGSGGGSGGGGKGGSGSTSYSYSAAVMIGISNTPISAIHQVWDGKSTVSLGQYNLTLFGGGYGQGAWGYLGTGAPFVPGPGGVTDIVSVLLSAALYAATGTHPDQSLNYRGLAYVAAGPMPLGNNTTLPSLSYEVTGPLSGDGGTPDVNPAVWLRDALTNPEYGLGFPANRVGDLSGWSLWCRANRFYISPVIDSATSANSVIADVLAASNAAAVWAGGQLTVVPYGDTSVSGDGITWFAPSAPVYTFTDSDFIQGGPRGAGGAGPVHITRKARREAINDVWVEYWDRVNAYNATIIEVKDEAMIASFGLRPQTVKNWHFITTAAVATTAAQFSLGRAAIMTTFVFRVGQEYILLDPMDVVALVDPTLGLTGQWVRITEITENADATLTVTAEELLAGPGVVASVATQGNSGFNPNWNAAPPGTNAPILLAAPPEVAQGLELWLVVSGAQVAAGGVAWGGCGVFLSSDNATYTLLGNQSGPGIQGVSTAVLAVGSDPDLADTLTVDLSQSGMILLPVAQGDADSFRSLCWIANPDGSNGEFIAYRDATLTGASVYTLGYLRRGLYGTTATSHPAGSVFARLDDRVFKIAYTALEIGTTRYLKLPAINIYGGGEQDISAVTATAVTLPAPAAPPAVTGFTVGQPNNDVVFTWVDSRNWALKGYDILYGPVGGAVATATMLTEASRATEMTNGSVPPGTWTFYIRGRDQFNQVGPAASQSLTVVNVNSVIATQSSGPGWLGTLNGLLRHHTGVLVPDSRVAASAMSKADLFTRFVPYPVATATYTAPAMDSGTQGTVRVFAALQGSGIGYQGSELSFSLDGWADGAADSGVFVPWGGGSLTGRYAKGRVTMDTSRPCVITGFDLTIDAPIITAVMTNVAVAASGTTSVAFAKTYHSPPAVQVSPSDGTSTGGGAANITATGCTVQLFRGAVLAAGVATLTITGN